MSDTQTAEQLDGRGLDEVRLLTNAMREHQNQISDLGKRRKQFILRLRKQRITYREIADAMGVSEQLIYKIIRHDIDRAPTYDADGKVIRRRGRPPKPTV
jgi:DNA invertase Pin-like site-specific DNA recombinase